MGETTQLKWLVGADLSSLVCVDVLARASLAQPLKVSCSMQVIHPSQLCGSEPVWQALFPVVGELGSSWSIGVSNYSSSEQ